MTANLLATLLKVSPVVPVVTLNSADDGVKLAEALLKGGIGVIEITLRTEAGIKAIREVAKHVPKMVVGAGTVTNAEMFKAAVDAGSQFIVSPGLTDKLANAVAKEKTPFLPGISTTTELMHAREYGYDYLKFFPASLSGGVGALKQFASVFPQVTFCPTGGITLDNANDYLRLPNVICVGGSWIAPNVHIQSGNWEEISRLCGEAIHDIAKSA